MRPDEEYIINCAIDTFGVAPSPFYPPPSRHWKTGEGPAGVRVGARASEEFLIILRLEL